VAEYLKLPDVARRLDVSEKTARRYVKSGELPSVFIGGAYRVSENDLEAFLSRAKVTPGVGYPKGERRSSPEPSLFNGFTEERRSPMFLEAIATAADGLMSLASEPDLNMWRRFGIGDAALLLIGALHERVSEEAWETLPNEERLKLIDVSEKLLEASSQSIARVEDELLEEEADQRREKIREWTQRISA
jgi:excisionase family DNA binding protein